MEASDPEVDLTTVPAVGELDEEPPASSSGIATAGKALRLLSEKHDYIAPTSVARRHVAMAFAARNKVVYGKAFDAIRLADGAEVDFEQLGSVEENIDSIVLCEIKSTRRDLEADFAGYFFGLSTAELLVAQSLGRHFEFALVNTESEAVVVLSLKELLARIKAIYPAWSISI